MFSILFNYFTATAAFFAAASSAFFRSFFLDFHFFCSFLRRILVA